MEASTIGMATRRKNSQGKITIVIIVSYVPEIAFLSLAGPLRIDARSLERDPPTISVSRRVEPRAID